MKKLVVLTGAGISAESGIQTFRDTNGLWHGHNLEEVATPQGFAKNPALVLDFYNQRRKNIKEALPNAAHCILSDLQSQFDVQIITQNIDDLHERAGSKKVMHLHGEIFKCCATNNKSIVYPILDDLHLGDVDENGVQLRPFIVWFNEDVPMMPDAMEICKQADIFIIIGTSLVVYPAANLVEFVPNGIPIYIIDKKIPDLVIGKNYTCFEKTASKGLMELRKILLD
jgi:NAD-dependent deacetylase